MVFDLFCLASKFRTSLRLAVILTAVIFSFSSEASRRPAMRMPSPSPVPAQEVASVDAPAEEHTSNSITGDSDDSNASAGIDAVVSSAVSEVSASERVVAPTPPKQGLFDRLFTSSLPAEEQKADPIFDFDERMIDAMRIAERSARNRSIRRCWRFVKQALVSADAIACYPKTVYAKQAAEELPRRYGFTRLDVTEPHDAPVGSVLVYGGRGAGHVEFRTENGFVSDHASSKPSPRPLIGVFVKPNDG